MLSIITINYNNNEGLKKTLESVRHQSFDGYEHIVIDGDSNDGSKQLLEEYQSEKCIVQSEPDSGIYNAMNKGIRKAKGDYLLFLNSGDVFSDENTLGDMHPYLDGKHALVYGDITFDKGDEQNTFTYPDVLDFEFFMNRSLGHPATFIKRSLFDEIGLYDESMKICSDWSFFILAVCKQGVSYKHVNRVIAVFEMLGVSNDPENQALIETEKQQVLEAHFGHLMREYQQRKAAEERLDSGPHRMIGRIWKHGFLRKLTIGYFKFVNLFIKKR